MERILIIGATSAIAQSTARLFAAEGASLVLVGRDPEKLRAVADDLRVRGARRVETMTMDASEYDRHQDIIEEARRLLGGLDTALIAHGTLPDQKACERSFDLTRREFATNALSVISLLTHLANSFERQGYGTLAVISSVAGDRGRQSNYVYGAAKAAVTAFLSGLRGRLHQVGVHVLTVKPGPVDTPMTARFRKGLLWAAPETVGAGIFRAIKTRRDVAYLPWVWYLFMVGIRGIPERLFKRLRL